MQLTETQYTFKRVAVLKAGDSFGELALIDSKSGQRAARIVSLENECQMAVI